MKAVSPIRILQFTLLCVLLISAAQAQDEAPLLRLLNAIPDNVVATETLSYADYQALIAARPDAPVVTTAEEWLALEDSPEGDVWFAAFMGLSSGPEDLVQFAFRQPLEAREATGIDPYTIERAVSYGSPPDTVVLLEGSFDEAEIAAAYTAREYKQNTMEGLTLWCGNEGCDGTQIDLSARNPADPFGGSLGRTQSVLVSETLVASSPNTNLLEEQAKAIAGTTPTLAENPDYRAAAEAITQEGLLIQAWFINPADIGSFSTTLMNHALSAEQLEALRETFERDFTPLPQYRLLALADTATETEQIALVALVYENADEAQEAGEILLERIERYESVVNRLPLRQILEERGVTAVETALYAGEERTVLLVRLRAPLPTKAPTDDGRLMSSSLVFRLLVSMYFQRDTGWLATAF